MDRSSKNYIPPVKMASAGGVMLNMSTVKSISIGSNVAFSDKSIIVSYINGDSEEIFINGYPSDVINNLMSQM